MEIRKAKDSDLENIMEFIGTHWKSGHILSENKPFMEWQHKSKEGFNFIIAVSDGVISAILGYIDSQRYDKTCSVKTIWLALWKVKSNLKISGLGLKLIRALETEEQPHALGVNGTVRAQWPIYKVLRFNVFSLKCFYLTNALVPKRIMVPCKHESEDLVTIDRVLCSGNLIMMSSNELNELQWNSYTELNEIVKTPYYFNQRYLMHPLYSYQVYKISGNSHLDALVATRIVAHNNAKVLRIVDFSGDLRSLACLGILIREILEKEGIEYCDFWQYGIDDKILKDSGFNILTDDSGVIIPNFFEPFIKENAEVHSVFKTDLNSNYIVCKGDGDQDRPSELLGKL